MTELEKLQQTCSIIANQRNEALNQNAMLQAELVDLKLQLKELNDKGLGGQ